VKCLPDSTTASPKTLQCSSAEIIISLAETDYVIKTTSKKRIMPRVQMSTIWYISLMCQMSAIWHIPLMYQMSAIWHIPLMCQMSAIWHIPLMCQMSAMWYISLMCQMSAMWYISLTCQIPSGTMCTSNQTPWLFPQYHPLPPKIHTNNTDLKTNTYGTY
jgi:hypothetical protein